MAASEDLLLRMRTEGARQSAAEIGAVSGEVRDLGRETKTAGSRMTSAGKKMDRLGRGMTRNVSVPIALAGAASVKFAVEFDKQMRAVNSIAKLPGPQFKDLRNQVLALAGPTAQAPSSLAEGLNDLIQAGYSAPESMKILGVSARTASAGMTDAKTSTQAITAVLKTYGLGAGKAASVSDTLFQTYNLGKLSVADLANTLPSVIQPASQLNIALDQVGQGYSVLTNRGFSAEAAATGLRNIMANMIKPSKGLDQAFGKLGVKSGPQLIKKYGTLNNALQELYKGTGKNDLAFQKLFRGQVAGSAAIGFVGKNAKESNRLQDQMAEKAGATDSAYSEMEKSVSQKWAHFASEFKANAIKVGDVILPVLDDIMTRVSSLIDEFKKLPGPVQKAAGYVAVGMAALGPLLVAGGVLAKGAGGMAKMFRKVPGLGKLAGKGKFMGATPVYVVNMGPGMGGPGGGKGGRLGRIAKGAAPFGARAATSAVGVGGALMGAYAVALGIPAYIGYKYFTRPSAASTLRKSNRRAAAVRRNRNQARMNMGGKPGKEPIFDAQGFPTGRYQPGFIGANTRASAGYKGIPTAATAKAIAKAVEQRPQAIIVQIDGKTVARAVHRQAVKDKSRR